MGLNVLGYFFWKNILIKMLNDKVRAKNYSWQCASEALYVFSLFGL